MSFAQPGLGSAVPPAPRTLPSASGSAGRPPPAGSAPCRNSLSTRHRAQDTCQNHILLLARPRQAWGHRQSLCGSSCHTPCPKPLVFEPPMSYPLCLSLPCPSPCIPAHISPPCSTTLSQPLVPVCVSQLPHPSPPVLPCALCLSDLELLEDLRGQEWRELPPLVRADPAVPGEGCRAPAPLLCSRFHLGFPWGGGQDRSAVPHHQPGSGTQLPKTRPPHSPSAAAMDLTLSRHCSASFSSLGVSGVTPSLFSVGRACWGHCRISTGETRGRSCLTCPCRLLLQGLGDQGDALQVLHVGILPKWGLSRDPRGCGELGNRPGPGGSQLRGPTGHGGSPGVLSQTGMQPRDADESRDAG